MSVKMREKKGAIEQACEKFHFFTGDYTPPRQTRAASRSGFTSAAYRGGWNLAGSKPT
jgi:hypothetical protein